MRTMLLGATAPILLLTGTAATAAPPSWRISEATGDVRLIDNGSSKAAVRGALLASGATIVTGASARAVIVRGKEFVVVSPRSRVRLPSEGESRGGLIQMITDFGSSIFRIEKKSTPHFGVKTPFLAAVVKGTTFTVTVGAQGSTVQVTEGAVEVSTLDGGVAEIIRPGSIAAIGASDLFQLTIQGDVSKVLRSEAATGGPAQVPAGNGAVTPTLQIAPMEAVIAEESSSIPIVEAHRLDSGSSVELLLAELGSDAVDTAHARDDAARKAMPRGEESLNPTPADGAPTGPGRPGGGSDAGGGKDDAADKPGKDDDTGKPDKDGSGDKPDKDDGGDKPDKDDGGDKPDKNDGGDKPEGGDTPDDGGDAGKPDLGGDDGDKGDRDDDRDGGRDDGRGDDDRGDDDDDHRGGDDDDDRDHDDDGDRDDRGGDEDD